MPQEPPVLPLPDVSHAASFMAPLHQDTSMNGQKEEVMLAASFNQDYSSLGVCTSLGYRLFNVEPFGRILARNDGGVKILEMLFSSSLIAVVGIGESATISPRSVHIINFRKQAVICKLNFQQSVQAVHMNRRRLVVVHESAISIYDIGNMRLIHTIDLDNSLNTQSSATSNHMTGQTQTFKQSLASMAAQVPTVHDATRSKDIGGSPFKDAASSAGAGSKDGGAASFLSFVTALSPSSENCYFAYSAVSTTDLCRRASAPVTSTHSSNDDVVTTSFSVHDQYQKSRNATADTSQHSKSYSSADDLSNRRQNAADNSQFSSPLEDQSYHKKRRQTLNRVNDDASVLSNSEITDFASPVAQNSRRSSEFPGGYLSQAAPGVVMPRGTTNAKISSKNESNISGNNVSHNTAMPADESTARRESIEVKTVHDSKDGDVVIFDAVLKLPVARIAGHVSGLVALAFSSTGELLASASCRGTLIRVFSVPEGALLHLFRRGSMPTRIHSLAFSLCQTMLAVSSESSTVHVFKLSAAKPENATPSSFFGVTSSQQAQTANQSSHYQNANALMLNVQQNGQRSSNLVSNTPRVNTHSATFAESVLTHRNSEHSDHANMNSLFALDFESSGCESSDNCGTRSFSSAQENSEEDRFAQFGGGVASGISDVSHDSHFLSADQKESRNFDFEMKINANNPEFMASHDINTTSSKNSTQSTFKEENTTDKALGPSSSSSTPVSWVAGATSGLRSMAVSLWQKRPSLFPAGSGAESNNGAGSSIKNGFSNNGGGIFSSLLSQGTRSFSFARAASKRGSWSSGSARKHSGKTNIRDFGDQYMNDNAGFFDRAIGNSHVVDWRGRSAVGFCSAPLQLWVVTSDRILHKFKLDQENGGELACISREAILTQK